MIDRGADKRQAQSNIHGLAKGKTFYRNHCLVMIASNYRIKLAARRAQEDSISRKRPGYIHVVNTVTCFDCRHDFRSLLNAEQSTFRTMRVQGSDRQARPFNAPASQLAMG